MHARHISPCSCRTGVVTVSRAQAVRLSKGEPQGPTVAALAARSWTPFGRSCSDPCPCPWCARKLRLRERRYPDASMKRGLGSAGGSPARPKPSQQAGSESCRDAGNGYLKRRQPACGPRDGIPKSVKSWEPTVSRDWKAAAARPHRNEVRDRLSEPPLTRRGRPDPPGSKTGART